MSASVKVFGARPRGFLFGTLRPLHSRRLGMSAEARMRQCDVRDGYRPANRDGFRTVTPDSKKHGGAAVWLLNAAFAARASLDEFTSHSSRRLSARSKFPLILAVLANTRHGHARFGWGLFRASKGRPVWLVSKSPRSRLRHSAPTPVPMCSSNSA